MASLSHGLCGSAGEFYVAAELSRRGFLATITGRNAESVDVLAAKPNSGVEALQYKESWHLLDDAAAADGSHRIPVQVPSSN